MQQPRLLDLFCGAGGAAYGYMLAGFHVTGVDLKPQPRCTPCPCRGLQGLYPHWVRGSVWLALLAFCGACWWGILSWLL